MNIAARLLLRARVRRSGSKVADPHVPRPMGGQRGRADEEQTDPDTSRCVAEKKYTEQQAKKLFPQVFVPVCNPDGTYSEVTARHHALPGAPPPLHTAPSHLEAC
ncbi:SPARC-related modular calcium-binding protein 2 [Liparis tanakae]|uniref:SPARC-related modular calcium-binding protein 2 n=1 Tax=Liparis tanakae TaxID=230148 RepID=A0A4Z2EF75_9TELE|nr:SPARC-related modular calcium-binding protein 2 [Liparis tanakae]